MVLDTSAALAILFDEPEGEAFVDAVLAADTRFIAAPNFVEAAIVAEARAGEHAGRELELLLDRLRVKVAPTDEAEARLAQSAWRRYGKGNHKAGLNFGDCFAYAAARARDDVLLFKGDDFGLTDVRRALPT